MLKAALKLHMTLKGKIYFLVAIIIVDMFNECSKAMFKMSNFKL